MSRGSKLFSFRLVTPKQYNGTRFAQVVSYLITDRSLIPSHFHWMAQHGVDGAFLQRFAGQCDIQGGNEGIRRIRDEVGDLVKDAAEKEGRVFAIM